jgi:hypothetical protein
VTEGRDISIGNARYRLRAVQREGVWVAHAERIGSNERFGTECSGQSESDALDRLAQWLEWQHEHAVALEALQEAERAYHRTIAGSAFVSPVEGPSAVELQRESLEELRAAREQLDAIRQREP